MNGWDILILLLVAAGVFLAVRTLRGRKKTGCSGCCEACLNRCPAGRERK